MAPKKNTKKKNTTGNQNNIGGLDLDSLMAEASGEVPQQTQSTEIETSKNDTSKEVSATEPKEEKVVDSLDMDDADAFLNSLTSGSSNKNKNKNKKKKNAVKETPIVNNNTEDKSVVEGTTEITTENTTEGDNNANTNKNKNKKDKKKNKKEEKVSAMGALIQARLEQQRKEEEERKKKEEEERLRIEEEERKRKEEEDRILQKKLRKKEKEREKIEKQKAEGTYLTEGQKRKLKQDRERIERMKLVGIVVPEIEKNTENKDKKDRRDKREMKKKQQEEEQKKQEEEQKKQEEESKTEEEDVVDDWEAMLDGDEGTEFDIPAEEPVEEPVEESSEESSEETESSDYDSDMDEEERREYEIEKARDARIQRENKARENRSPDNLRCPVVVVMGHVDTGKTSLLDKIRRTNVQTGEAGGITQQIGATYLPADNLKKCTDKAKKYLPVDYKVPGLLVIDTPGHESFSNLRSRGSSLCDIAILVVDIMHGLENQTIESLNMLLEKKVPFIVALNKIDRMYGWETHKDMSFKDTFNQQPKYTKEEFETRTQKVIGEFMTRGLNASLYWENDDTKNTISLVPTSAVTGEGLSDLLGLTIKLTQEHMTKKLMFYDVVQCTILEKKVDEGLGLTLDVILINGTLHTGDTIVLTGINGPIVTQIRALLTPEPMKDARVKVTFARHDSISGAIGLKISANNLDEAIAGSTLYVCSPKDNLEELKDTAQVDLKRFKSLLHKNEEGVFVQASTIGSLEALLEFLNKCSPPIPVSGFNIGPLHKKDVIQASIMLEKKPEYATILAFDVKITTEAQQYADETGVRIFSADIIYHLFDRFTEYIDSIRDEEKQSQRRKAVFPCVLKIIPQYIFNRQNPIVVGVDVQQGILKPNTPVFVIKKEEVEVKTEGSSDAILDEDVNPTEEKKMKTIYRPLVIGTVGTIELDHKNVAEAAEGKSVAISINQNDNQCNIAVGRQFDTDSLLYSFITRDSIDALKQYFRNEMKDDYWKLIIDLKKKLNIN